MTALRPPRSVIRAAAVVALTVVVGAACGETPPTIATTGTTVAATTTAGATTTPTSTATTAAASTTTTAAATTTSPTTTTTTTPLALDGPGRYEVEVLSGGLARRVLLVVPESAPSPAPLVVAFHGFTRNPEEVERQSGLSSLAEEHGFVVAYPAGTGFPPRWLTARLQGDQDVALFRDLVAVVSAAWPIDPHRIYAAGFSNGGGMAARLACDAADLVAAAGPVAAAYPIGPCDPARPVPIIAFHGTGDPIVPYGGVGVALPAVEGVMADWAGRNGCAPEPVVVPVTADVARVAWSGCDAGADVVLYRVDGGGHGWPGAGSATFYGWSTDSVSASALLWEFFAAHPVP